MKEHLQYIEPTRSEVGKWKSTGYNIRFNYEARRNLCKRIGKALATSGVFKTKPVDAVAVMRVLTQNAGGSYSRLTSFVSAILGGGVADAMRRDAMRFSTNHWVDVPWREHQWYLDSPYRGLHSAHLSMSEKNKGKVVFAENLDKLKRDLFTPINPGRYLSRFFGDVLSEAEIKEWAEKYAAMFAAADLNFVESNDPDGWVRVYADGPQSCMQGENSVRIYAHDKSVLRLAYMTRGSEIINRAIVREDTTPKEYIRVYPSCDGIEHTLLKEALTAHGYVQGGLKGVLLDAIPHDGGDWVCPYLDSGAGSNSATELDPVYIDGNDYLRVVRSGRYDGQVQGGYVGETGIICHDCDEREDEDDAVYVEYGEYHICQHCYDYHYVTAMGRRYETIMREDEAILCKSDNTYYHPEYAADHDVYECEINNEYYKLDDLVNTSRGLVHTDDVVELDVADTDGNDYAYFGDTVTTHDGRTIHKDNATLRTVWFHEDDDIENDQTPNDVTNTNAA
jgi:hypothetical protein